MTAPSRSPRGVVPDGAQEAVRALKERKSEMNRLKLLFTIALMALIPGTALADGEFAPDDSANDIPSDTAAVDGALDLYWAQNREVEAIQRRLFTKDSRHEFTLFVGMIPNDEFYTYLTVGARYDYFFTEDIAVELWGAYDHAFNSDLKDFLESTFRETLLVDIPQSLLWMAGVNALWSPIHGKFAIFTTKLAHFDVHLSVGAGAVGTTVRKLEQEELAVDIAGNVGLGFRVYLLDFMSLRVDYRQYFYAAETGGIAKPAEFSLGVSFFTEAPK